MLTGLMTLKTRSSFHWGYPVHTYWDTCPGWEITFPKPDPSNCQSAVCAGQMRTLQTPYLHCHHQRLWAAQIKQSHEHWRKWPKSEFAEDPYTFIRIRPLFTIKEDNGWGPLKHEDSMSDHFWVKGAIKLGEDQSKLSVKYQNGK